MNNEQVKEVEQKLLEINQIISKLDSEIKGQAFDILSPYYFEVRLPEKTIVEKGAEKVEEIEEISEDKEDKFFKANSQKKPSDNVYLIFAWFYSQYGSIPIYVYDKP